MSCLSAEPCDEDMVGLFSCEEASSAGEEEEEECTVRNVTTVRVSQVDEATARCFKPNQHRLPMHFSDARPGVKVVERKVNP